LKDRFVDLYAIAARVCHRTAGVPKEPEAPEWAPLGQYAWAARREAMPDEPDNACEDELFQDLRSHFSSSRTGLPARSAALLSIFVRLGWYAPVLHPPPQPILYRGIKLRSRAAVASLANVEEEEIAERGSVSAPGGVVIPSVNGHSTSWSSKKRITKDFSSKGKAGYSVTLIAEVGANPGRFLAGPGGLYDVDGMSRWHQEKETVGLEPITISRIEWSRL
jgi:hypothetical protein